MPTFAEQFEKVKAESAKAKSERNYYLRIRRDYERLKKNEKNIESLRAELLTAIERIRCRFTVFEYFMILEFIKNGKPGTKIFKQ